MSQLYAVPRSSCRVCVMTVISQRHASECLRLPGLCALAVLSVTLSTLQFLELGKQCFLRMCILKTINFLDSFYVYEYLPAFTLHTYWCLQKSKEEIGSLKLALRMVVNHI